MEFVKLEAAINAGQNTGGLIKPVAERNPKKGQRNLKVWPETSDNFQIAKGEFYLVHPACVASDKEAGQDKSRRVSIFKHAKDEGGKQ